MLTTLIPTWKTAPFLRVLLPFACGILIQWYTRPDWRVPCSLFLFSLLILLRFQLAGAGFRYRYGVAQGAAINLLIGCTGMAAAWLADVQHQPQWLGRHYRQGQCISIQTLEPPSEKAKSRKALARVNFLWDENEKALPVTGSVILYFEKDSLPPPPYGAQLIFKKPLQPIRSTGNPGGFNFERYCHFNGITHQVFLRRNDFVVLPGLKTRPVHRFLFKLRETIVGLLEKYIPHPRESGVAQALLIGYRNNLDKELVQQYSNTGVVHVIAISGLHLGLIYSLLLFLLQPLEKSRRFYWLRPVLIISALWLFSLLAGAGASVLRSALMFTVIAIGETLKRKSCIYNSLAASAFILLLLNPFLLWDIGFQLSYLAVLSIALFMKPLYHCLSFKNKIADGLWKLNAVTLAAQVLTLPLLLYQFHQFPTLFLLTNLVAVPLSSLILFLLLLLCALGWWPAAAALAGQLSQWLLRCMNGCIEWVDGLHFSLISHIPFSLTETLLAFAVIASLAWWIHHRPAAAFISALSALCLLLACRAALDWKALNRQHFIVYHIPKNSGIEWIQNGKTSFIGPDSVFASKAAFYIYPAHHYFRLGKGAPLKATRPFLLLQTARGPAAIINKGFRVVDSLKPLPVNWLVVTANPKISMAEALRLFRPQLIVFDASNQFYRIAAWKKECLSHGIPFHDVTADGAFVGGD